MEERDCKNIVSVNRYDGGAHTVWVILNDSCILDRNNNCHHT